MFIENFLAILKVKSIKEFIEKFLIKEKDDSKTFIGPPNFMLYMDRHNYMHENIEKQLNLINSQKTSEYFYPFNGDIIRTSVEEIGNNIQMCFFAVYGKYVKYDGKTLKIEKEFFVFLDKLYLNSSMEIDCENNNPFY